MVSIVVPVFNEQESLDAFYARLKSAIILLDKKHEIIFVDDGSTDKSLEILTNLAQKDKNIRLFSFRKNQGKAESLSYGFQKAKGKQIVTLDADLQDSPQDIPLLLQQLDAGYEVVCGWRKDRKDSLKKVLASKLFNFLVKIFWGTQLHDYNCGLKAYTMEAAKSLSLYGGMHRFIPLLLHTSGFKITETVVNHSKRKFGKSKYGFSKIWKDLPDMFTILFLSRYSERPLHFFGVVGGMLTCSGVIILIYLTILHYVFGQNVGTRPLLLFGILFVIGGFQISFTGFIADLIISTFHQFTTKEVQENRILLRYSTDK